jgi:choline dehydrogenase-like flavoprotein
MLTDALALDDGATLDTDLCVIGAGPAGIAIALELAGTGIEVLLLESGGITPERRDRKLAVGENADPRYYRVGRSRVVGFAGSSNHWMHTSGMRARPLDALDFAERPEVGRGGWPFGRSQLDTTYRRAQELCRLGPFEYDTVEREHAVGTRLPLDPSLVETVMFQIAALGNFAGRLNEVVAASNVHLFVHATALELDTNDSGDRVEEIRVAAGDNKRFAVRPGAVVLACGGLENARMLLLSNRVHTLGLGNAGDQVGRYLMEHPHVRTGVVVPTDLSLVDRLALYERRETDGVESFGMLKLPDDVLRDEALLGCAWSLDARPPAIVTPAGRSLVGLREAVVQFRRPIPHTRERVATVLRRPVEAARSLVAWKQPGSSPPVLALHAMSEQAPNPASRVVLGKRHDRFGRPVARVDWRLTALDRRTIRRSQELLGLAFSKAGLGRIEQLFGEEIPPTVIGGGFHHIGTTRMGADPTSSVVDANSRVHGVANCYVTGMSVFPTGGYANPTLTVVALAVRLAAHLRDELGG